MKIPLMLLSAVLAVVGHAVPSASGGSRSVATEPVGLAPRADRPGRAVAPRPPQPARRARPPLMRRREGAIPGIVTIPYGKTASGERTHIYRIMGQGGVVADFTDYGARLVRLYTPDATADLANILEGFKPSVIACEKAGDVADVWKMTPIRRPRATGLVFEPVGSTLRADRLDTAPGGSRSRATASSNLPPGVTAVRPSATRHKPPVKRAIDTIQLDELAQAMRDVEADFGACERDALYRETLKRFGLTVLTPKARTHLDAAFRRK